MVIPSLILCPVLIGRTHDRDSLFHLLDELDNEHGKTLLISGEAGIGKSRLLNEAKTHAKQSATLVLQGNCFEQDYALPYAPLIDLLRGYFAKLAPEAIAQICGTSGPELITLLPELAAVLQYPVLTTHAPDQEKRRCFYALLQFFIRLSSEEPLVIVIEDLHWSDDTSLEFLLHFARQITSYPILLVLTYRTDEAHPTLQYFLGGLDRQRLALEFPLSRLSMDETKEMIGAIFNRARPVSAEFVDLIFRLTEGNPFFTEEILKSLITTGDIVFEEANWDRKPTMELHIPRSIQDSVQRRMDGLNEDIQRIITLAAVIGQRFDFTLLRDLTGQTDAELVPIIKALINAQLVVQISSEQFAFRHALTRQAIYTSLLKREQAVLHQSIAVTIERLHVHSLDSYLAELAYHFYAAGNWERALHYCRRAGERASQLYALQSAIDNFTQALDAARQLSLPLPVSLQRARGLIYEARGDFERARFDHELVLQTTQGSNDRVAEWQALLDLGMLWASRDYTQSGEYYEQALLVAHTINDPLLIARSLNRLGNWYANVGKAVEGLQAHNTALELFQAQDDKQGVAATLDLLGMANGIYGDILSSVKHFRQAIALFRELDDPQALSWSLTAAAVYATPSWAETTASPLGKLAEAERNREEALGLVHKIGSLADEAYAEWTGATVCLGFGEFGRALRHAQRSLDVATEIEHPQWTAAAYFSLGQVYLTLLAPEQAIQAFEAG
ncbi:MAG: AAA family ATPase, partial [Chloroflexota bacterium]